MASLRGYRVQCFPGHKKTVNHVAWSASGERLASASSDNGGRVWALKSGGLTCECCLGAAAYPLTVRAQPCWSSMGTRRASPI